MKIQGPSTLLRSPHILSLTLKTSSVGEKTSLFACIQEEEERLTNQCLQVTILSCVREGTVTVASTQHR